MNFVFLSDEFYRTYQACPEIEQKKTRPYIMVCVKINGVSFAVPLRSNINHKYVLWTDRENHCGVDLSKAVVISKQSYIDKTKTPHVRQNEFDALRGKEYLVAQRLKQYIAAYKKAKARSDILRNKIIIQYSTLQYFEEYL